MTQSAPASITLREGGGGEWRLGLGEKNRRGKGRQDVVGGRRGGKGRGWGISRDRDRVGYIRQALSPHKGAEIARW